MDNSTFFGEQFCPDCKQKLNFVEELVGPFSFEYGGTAAKGIYRCNSSKCQARPNEGYFTCQYFDDPSGGRNEDFVRGRF